MDNLSITLNGRSETLPVVATILEILQAVAIDPGQRGIAVAVNDRVVRRGEWEIHKLADGDRIDVIQATQGG